MSNLKLFAANWKLNKGPKETKSFLKEFISQLPTEKQSQVVFFVPATNLESTESELRSTQIRFGSQNCYSQNKGAFTGEISAEVVKEIGAQFILLGHSERRHIFNESSDFIASKGKLVQSLQLTPMICIGETLEEREAGQTESVCEKQLISFMRSIDLKKDWVVAYEPVWAIGTSRVASLSQITETHAQIRSIILREGGTIATPILYGGSVKPENAKELLSVPEVGGFLVGGASLDPQSFIKICL